MSLSDYRRKRSFQKTPEPAGRESVGEVGALRFIVHKHQASHLHYDFRLELDGVLLSWAVPKGPSLRPSEKRLAMRVEDHPLDYADFEGVIPPGNYGAGAVIVWDVGTYTAIDASDSETSASQLRAGLAKGHLALRLAGQKLRGDFDVIHTPRRQPNAWLLVKRDDQFARDIDIREEDRSVRSGRTIADVEAGVAASPAFDLSALPRQSFPTDLRPMLATLTDQPFDREGWLFEIKWDGYRALAEVRQGTVRLRSRRGQDFTSAYPTIVESLRALSHDAVLDGEIVALDAAGRPQFQLLQNYDLHPSTPLVYYVFDLLHLDGHDTTALPLVERKCLLAQILPPSDRVRYCDHVTDTGVAFFEAATGQGLEGIIAKDGDSQYESGRRSRHWLKVRAHRRQEAVIGGYTAPRGSRTGFGSLLLGVYRESVLTPIGHVGTGFDEVLLQQLFRQLQPLIRATAPFTPVPPTNMPATWVEPRLVCEVQFTEWTAGGSLRHPVFLGLRPDKQPEEVVIEEPMSAIVIPQLDAADERTEQLDGHAVTFTHLAKIWWPVEGYTKADAINYYRTLAPVLLPYLHDRPMVLLRHPHGIAGESFYQKDMRGQVPDWVQTVAIPSESRGTPITYLLCQDTATLLYLINLGCIELNPWHARVPALMHPDYCVLDLDPLEIDFAAVVRTAREVKKLCDEIGITTVPKTSGKRGLHICIPLGGQYDTAQVGLFVELLAQLVYVRLPEITSVARSPRERVGRVYLDYLQNRRGQTIVAPYSLRPVPGAPVSMPLRWSEVKKGLDPQHFTIQTAHHRLDRVGDLWAPVLGPGVDLAAALARMEENR